MSRYKCPCGIVDRYDDEGIGISVVCICICGKRFRPHLDEMELAQSPSPEPSDTIADPQVSK